MTTEAAASKNSNNFKIVCQAATAEDGSKQTVIKLKLDPFATPSFLGDVRSGAANQIPPESHYGRLRRPSIDDLPGPHSADRTFWDKTAEKPFLKIYRGDCSLVVVVTETEGRTSYEILALVEDSNEADVDDDSVFCGSLVSVTVESENGFAPDGFFLCSSCGAGERFVSLLKESQKDAIFSRILHVFLRVLGSRLKKEVFTYLVWALKGTYSQNHWWKETLDLSMISADVAFNACDSKNDIVRALVVVGESMEADKSYEDASLLYEEILTTYWTEGHPHYSRINLLSFVGVAMIRDSNFEQAESFILRSMHAELNRLPSYTSWDKPDSLLVDNFAQIYMTWFYVKPQDWPNMTLLVALLSLLTYAEANNTDKIKCRLPSLMGLGPGEDAHARARTYLKPRYWTKKAAQKALTSSLSDLGNVAKFRSVIIRCCPKNNIRMVRIFTDGKGQFDTKKKHAKLSKQVARSEAGSKNSKACTRKECRNKACKTEELLDVKELMHCPCETTVYVSIPVLLVVVCLRFA